MDLGREIEKEVDPTGEFTKDLEDVRRDMDLKNVSRQSKPAVAESSAEDRAKSTAEHTPAPDATSPVKPSEPESVPASTEPRSAAGGDQGRLIHGYHSGQSRRKQDAAA